MRHRRAWLHWRAVQRHGDIQPCGGKTWPECYTYEYPAIPAAACQGTQYVQFATKKTVLRYGTKRATDRHTSYRSIDVTYAQLIEYMHEYRMGRMTRIEIAAAVHLWQRGGARR